MGTEQAKGTCSSCVARGLDKRHLFPPLTAQIYTEPKKRSYDSISRMPENGNGSNPNRRYFNHLWNMKTFIQFILSNPKFYTPSLYLKKTFTELKRKKTKTGRNVSNFLSHNRIKQYNVYTNETSKKYIFKISLIQ